jgi:Lon protease-like protein
VLFPSMPLPLHIFEERYRAMVQDIKHGDKRFCVALIKEGQEVGGEAVPCEVACLAEAVHLQSLADGRFFIMAVGVERVRILSTDRDAKPYLTGNLELWPDEGEKAEPDLLQRAEQLFSQYAHCIMKLSGQEAEKVPMPAEPELLSYVLATGLQMEALARQQLLELPGCKQRLSAEIEILQAELPMLRALASSPQPRGVGFGQFSAN